MKPVVALILSLCLSLSLFSSLQAQGQSDTPISKPSGGAGSSGSPEAQPETKDEKPQKRVFGKSEEVSFKGKVVVIKVGDDDLASVPRYRFIRRAVKRANEEGAAAVIFDLNTPGGFAWETTEFLMQDLARAKIKTIAYVNPNAGSAGALIAMGTDSIYMAPASAIGSAGVITHGAEMGEMERAKAESYFISAVRGVAKQKGYDPDIVSAMMKMEFIFEKGDIYVDSDEILTLNAQQATMIVDGKPVLAKGIMESLEEIIETEGLVGKEVVIAEPTGMEAFANWVAALSGVLILVGIGGAYLEMKTPGFGLGGGISLLAFSVFFFGNYAAGNMAGYGLMLLFVLGVILLIVEFVVLPGMIVPGVVGGILVLGSLFMAMVDEFAFDDNKVRGWDADGALDFISGPSMNLGIGLIGSSLLMVLMMRFLPNIPVFNRMVMSGELAKGDATGLDSPSGGTGEHVGLRGVTTTDLRPAGKGDFNGRTLDITAAEGFITVDKQVVVVSEDGLRILVEEE